jgi:hypothetical protein
MNGLIVVVENKNLFRIHRHPNVQIHQVHHLHLMIIVNVHLLFGDHGEIFFLLLLLLFVVYLFQINLCEEEKENISGHYQSTFFLS